AAAAGDGDGRDAADVPAGVDRGPPGDRHVRVRGPAGPGAGVRVLQLVGLTPSARGLPRARAVSPGAILPRAQGGAAEGSLRAVRGRLADLHRDAVRPARDQGDRARAAPAL